MCLYHSSTVSLHQRFLTSFPVWCKSASFHMSIRPHSFFLSLSIFAWLSSIHSLGCRDRSGYILPLYLIFSVQSVFVFFDNYPSIGSIVFYVFNSFIVSLLFLIASIWTILRFLRLSVCVCVCLSLCPSTSVYISLHFLLRVILSVLLLLLFKFHICPE